MANSLTSVGLQVGTSGATLKKINADFKDGTLNVGTTTSVTLVACTRNSSGVLSNVALGSVGYWGGTGSTSDTRLPSEGIWAWYQGDSDAKLLVVNGIVMTKDVSYPHLNPLEAASGGTIISTYVPSGGRIYYTRIA